jgi:hypothetical protein
VHINAERHDRGAGGSPDGERRIALNSRERSAGELVRDQRLTGTVLE